MKVQRSLDVSVPAQVIWPYFVIPEKILQWCITFKKFEYSNGKRGEAGAHVYIEEQAGGPLMKMNFEITECIENQKVTLTMLSGPMMKSYQQWWSLAAIPTGTRISFAEEIEFGMGLLGKLLGSFQEKTSLGTIEKMLARLKALVEA
jgi:hypothetical protein